MYLGLDDITSKSEVTKDHIPKLITAGVGICVGVMKNKLRNDWGFDVFKQVIIHADVVLREIYTRNSELGDQKFTVFQLFGHFLANLRDELVKVFLDTNFARYIKRKYTEPPTFGTGIRQIVVYISICYVIQRAGIFNLDHTD